MKPARGRYTKPNIWDKTRMLSLSRVNPMGMREPIDPGVNYFILLLEQLGLRTHWSCEGHPKGFYIVFDGPYISALNIGACGFLSVEVDGINHWSIRVYHPDPYTSRDHVDFLRWATEAWERNLGPLDLKAVKAEEKDRKRAQEKERNHGLLEEVPKVKRRPKASSSVP